LTADENHASSRYKPPSDSHNGDDVTLTHVSDWLRYDLDR